MVSGEGLDITELQCNDSFHARDSVHGICSSFNSCSCKLSNETFNWLVFWRVHATLSQLTIDVFIFTVRCQQDDLNVIMFTLCGWGDGPCWDFVTCNLVPTKNKSRVLCQPIVLAPVFAIIRPGEQKACFILQQFYTEGGGRRTKSPATVLLSTVPSFYSKYSFFLCWR